MNIVITGSRMLGAGRDPMGDLTELGAKQQKWMHLILKDYFCKPGMTMINGCAPGVDNICLEWAEAMNRADRDNQINIIRMPAEWNKYGKQAGYLRNAEMVSLGDCVLAFWNGASRGTKHTIDLALSSGKSVHVNIWRKS